MFHLWYLLFKLFSLYFHNINEMNKWDEGEWKCGMGILYIDSSLAIIVNEKGQGHASSSRFNEVKQITSRHVFLCLLLKHYRPQRLLRSIRSYVL
jgi:hypothetical protein